MPLLSDGAPTIARPARAASPAPVQSEAEQRFVRAWQEAPRAEQTTWARTLSEHLDRALPGVTAEQRARAIRHRIPAQRPTGSWLRINLALAQWLIDTIGQDEPVT